MPVGGLCVSVYWEEFESVYLHSNQFIRATSHSSDLAYTG